MAVRQVRAWLFFLLAGASCKPADISAPEFAFERERMVKQQVAMRGVTNERVLTAMRKVPREQFVPETSRGQSYTDGPLAIGYDQTISQPFVVAGVLPDFDGAALLADARRICEATIAFWHGAAARPPFDRYLFLLNAIDDGRGGLEHRASTALISPRRDLPRLAPSAGGGAGEAS